MASIKSFALVGFALSIIVAAPLNTAPAFASGGGGGGGAIGGSSGSVPQYDPAVEYQKGVKALKADDFKKASRSFGRVLKVARKDANTNYLMGLSQTGLEKHKKASKYYQKAVKYNENLFDAHVRLTKAYMLSGKTDDANSVLSALETRIAQCGKTCAQASELQKCHADVKSVIDSNTVRQESSLAPYLAPYLAPKNFLDGSTGYFEAVSLINQARYDEAIIDLKSMAAIMGPHPDIMNYLGYAHRKIGLYVRAEHYYGIALSVAPQHRGANEYLGELYLETGQFDKARVQLEKLENICKFGCAEEKELRGWILNAAP